MKIIVVNNPAAKNGGALTILKEFLGKIYSLKCNRKFYIIVSLEELKKYETDKVKIIVIEKQGFKDRILWDNLRLKKFLKNKNIMPSLLISLQNTGVNIDKKIPQFIYFHQSLSITNLKWNLFHKEERIYWMYKNIYPFFIRQYLKKANKIIVQTEWVKKAFLEKFNYSEKNMVLMKPSINRIDIANINMIDKQKYRIFYPASPFMYKNHKIVIKALGDLLQERNELSEKIECIFTFLKGENKELDELIKKYNLENIIKLIGKVNYEKVLEWYKSSDLLVFPSYLETFGLPLIEAQDFNLKILSVDEKYAREVTESYKNVEYINKNDLDKWKNQILKNLID
ncbi:MAG: glycosyltransferase [Cetobacterium sp.]|uniref:glycosyltransferase n=1 Tax=Cetobacterium sp. TaxID=2071632 RepID=UPI003F3E8D22